MTQEIWKIDLSQALVHELPIGAHPLHAQYVPDDAERMQINIWFMVDPRKRFLKRAFLVAGTGWSLPDFIRPEMHIGTCRNPHSGMVFHVFDCGYLEALKPYDRRTIEMLNTESGEDRCDR